MQRVFILSAHPLFGEGVEGLLQRIPGVQVVGCAGDLDEALARIEELTPDVVLLDTGHPACPPASAVAHVLELEACSEVRVVGVNMEDNTICVYLGERKQLADVSDLLRAMGLGPPAGQTEAEGTHDGHQTTNEEKRCLD